MEAKLKDLIENEINIPVSLDGENMVFPCATIEIREAASEGLYGDGRNVEEIGTYQIDIWFEDRTEWKTAEAKLKAKIKADITAPDISFSGWDTFSQKYRTTYTFSALSA